MLLLLYARPFLFRTTEGMSFKSHKGVLTAFGRDIAQTGKVPSEFGRMLRDAERLRNASDYEYDQNWMSYLIGAFLVLQKMLSIQA